jgi:membrane protein required for colicin V production
LENLPVNVTDLAIIAAVLISGILAFARGFFREVLSIGSWVAAFFAALYLHPVVTPYISQLLGWGDMASLAAGIAVFVVSVIVMSLFTHYVAAALQGSSLSAIDRSLGFLFGIARGAVLVCLLYLGLNWLIEDDGYPKWVTEARTLPLVQQGAETLVSLVPPHLRPRIRDAAGSAETKAREETQKLLYERLMSPPAKSDAPQGGDGYTAEQRRDLERVIENTQ